MTLKTENLLLNVCLTEKQRHREPADFAEQRHLCTNYIAVTQHSQQY